MKFRYFSKLFTPRTLLSVSVRAGVSMAALLALSLFAQEISSTGKAPLPVDWSFSHFIPTMSFTKQQAAKMKNDPRLYYQWLLKGHVQAKGDGAAAQAASFGAAAAPTKPSKSSNKVDWNLSLGTLGVAKNQSPAKFNFNINSPLTSANCTNDFVVYGLNGAATVSQANLVGVNNLYSGTSPTGLCGTAPTVYFAYYVTTVAGGAVTNSPILSRDGTEIAFIESAVPGQTILHVLAWAPNNGTVTSPITSINPVSSAAPGSGCFVPCMVSLTLDSSHGDTNSSIYYDYSGTDTAYVGNDSGTVFTISGTLYQHEWADGNKHGLGWHRNGAHQPHLRFQHRQHFRRRLEWRPLQNLLRPEAYRRFLWEPRP
jgi:hypothetical protein